MVFFGMDFRHIFQEDDPLPSRQINAGMRDSAPGNIWTSAKPSKAINEKFAPIQGEFSVFSAQNVEMEKLMLFRQIAKSAH